MPRRTSFAPLILALAASAAAGPARAQELLPARVEEDWELVLGDPDPVGAGPQVLTGMRPQPDNAAPVVMFALNYADVPAFQAGGMQVQFWQGDTALEHLTAGTEPLQTPGEVITWTQAMSLKDGRLHYAIRGGQSQTWGPFGDGTGLDLSGSVPSALTTLAGYTPGDSVALSGVGWQPNRVRSLTLRSVRYYTTPGGGAPYLTDSTSRSIPLAR